MNKNKTIPNVFLFDLDGTLIESKEVIERILNETLIEFGYQPFSEEEILSHLGTPLKKLLRTRVRNDDVERISKRYMEKFFEEGLKEVRVFDGVLELLQELKSVGIKVGIVTTKSEEEAYQVVEYLGLSKYTDVVVAYNDDVLPKPNADPILRACSLLEAEPSKAVMVGDTHIDIAAGRSAGTYANIGVLWGIGSEEDLKDADHLAYTVDELKEHIRKLRA